MTTMPTLAPPSRHPCSELQLTLELARDSDTVLLRVFSTLHRRRCRVLNASFRGSGGRTDRLQLRVEAPHASASQLARWLGALVDVHSAEGVAA
jgi:hypothetical protein